MKMKIEIKNCKVNMEFSQETIMFKADVYVNGRKVGYAYNEGYGGSTTVMGNSREDNIILRQAAEYMESQPPVKYNFNGEDFHFRQSLDNYIDDLVSKMSEKKEIERLKRKAKIDSVKGIVISKDNMRSYELISWKGHNIDSILRAANGYEVLKKAVDKYRGEGYTIYNENLPSNILN